MPISFNRHPQVNENRKKVGVVLTLLGVLAFSSKGVVAKLSYAHGVEPIALMVLRMSIAMPLFWILLFWIGSPRGGWQVDDVWRVILAGIFGYYLAQLFDLIALQTVTATLGRLILFTYPAFVILIVALRQRLWPGRRKILVLLICYLGLTVAVLGGGLEEVRATWSGIALMLLSAFLFAVYYTVAGDVADRFGTLRFSAVVMTVAGSCVLFHYLALHPLGNLYTQPPPVYGYAALLAIGVTVIPLILIVEGLRRIPTDTSAILNLAGPLFTYLLASASLDERLTLLQWVGFLVVLGGGWLLSRPSGQSTGSV